MNFQELLQGVLSGRWATTAGDDPYGAGKAAIGRDLGNLAGVLSPGGQQPGPQGALAAPQQAPAPPQMPQPTGMAGNGMSPQGAALPMGPGRDPPDPYPPGPAGFARWTKNQYDRQIQGALAQGAATHMGNDPVPPTASPQPGNGVLAQNNATAMRNQYDPFQPQASPQPGNGVLAQNNATAMSQANPMGPNQPPAPGGLPARGEDVYPPGGLSGPEANPKTWLPPESSLGSADMYRRAAEQQANGGYQQGSQAKPSAAKAPAKSSDPVTRAKGILAAATSGDPQAFTQAVTDPAAAAQAGSQTPDGLAGVEMAPGKGALAQPATTTPEGKPIPLADQHAEDKQKTFGQKFMGALADPDTQDLLQSIGIGLLSNPNAMKGMAEGMQLYQGLHLRRQQRDLEQKRIDIEDKRATSQEKYQDASLGQGQERIGLEKTDQDLRRQQYDITAKQQERTFGLEQARFAELGRHDRAEEGNSALSARTAALTAQLSLQRLRQGGDTPFNFGDTYYDDQGKALQQRRNQATGAVEYVDSATGQAVQNPQGLQRAQDAITKSINSQEGKIVGGILDAGQQAQTVKQRLGYARDVINANPGLYMGSGGDTVNAARKLAVSLGVAPDQVNNVADADTITTIAGQQMLTYVNETKGSISNYEDKKYLELSPGMTKTRAGNLRLIEMGYRSADRQVEKSEFFAQHDNLPYRNVDRMWRDYEDKNPVYAGMPGFGATPSSNGGNSVTVGGKTISYTVEK